MLIKAADGNHLSSTRLAALLAPLGLTENPQIYNPSFTIVAWLLCLMDYRGLIARCIKQAHHVNNTRPPEQTHISADVPVGSEDRGSV